MNFRIIISFIIAVIAGIACVRASEQPDSVQPAHRTLRAVEVVGMKQVAAVDAAFSSVTQVRSGRLRSLGVSSAKGLSEVAPNFFMPDYGSRMTSSIYVRGLGSRMDQPVVGLSVDGVPYLNKDTYDFDVDDVDRIDVWRGAQSVLNGRNSMAGQINIYTRSPWSGPRLRVMAGYGRANTWKAGAVWRTRVSETLATSVSANMRSTDGFFRNEATGARIDGEHYGAARWKTSWRPSAHMAVTNTAAAGVLRQGGYPYRELATGTIARNDTCFYRRTTFSDGLTVSWAGRRIVATSQTSVQYLNDNMTLDQDFTTADLFTLSQRRREWGFTEDLFTRGARGAYSWLGGVFAFYRPSHMDAPVDFKDQGIAQLIEHHRNESNPDYPISWFTRRFTLGSDFSSTNGGLALYHESKYSVGRWTFEGALRYDFEHVALHWHSACSTGYNTLHILPDGSAEHYRSTPVEIDEDGRMRQSFNQLLPKLAVSYSLGQRGNVYANVSKGYKAGGFNLQMFSDVLQQKLMRLMGFGMAYDPADVVSYRPETSWNYEAGAHLQGARWSLDATVFFIDTRDRQLTTFPAGSTTGRLMTNAARAHSYGAEATAAWRPADGLSLSASYGYTCARFRDYVSGGVNYKGRYLPYAPGHTLFASADWALPLSLGGAGATAGVNVRGAGPIYWDDANMYRQNFYATMGAHLTVAGPGERWSVRLWGENITDTRYDTFYFVSVGRAFVQPGRPWQAGVTLRWAFGDMD
ncbi:MAG: TonB-dependent receptor [Muribaculaceae bacterium]|nr:TonB-dependent receptor [Muribaculaceae bacterium]